MAALAKLIEGRLHGLISEDEFVEAKSNLNLECGQPVPQTSTRTRARPPGRTRCIAGHYMYATTAFLLAISEDMGGPFLLENHAILKALFS